MTDPAPSSRVRSRIGWGLAVLAVVVVIVGVALASRFGSDPSLVNSPLIGQKVPDIVLPYLEGAGQVALAEDRDEVLVVNFFASWCVGCREEHPGLVAAASFFADAPVRMVGIAYQDRTDDAIGFLDRFGRGYEYVDDPGSRAAIEFGVFGIPETFFIDRDGIITGKIAGPVTPSELAGTIERMLGDGA